jgi:glutamyl-tRNA synthetase
MLNENINIFDPKYGPKFAENAMGTAREKGKFFTDLPSFVGFYFIEDDQLQFDKEAKEKALKPESGPLLTRLGSAFDAVVDFKAAPLEAALKQLATELGVKAGALVQPCRVACTGKLIGPSLYQLLEVLGREKTLKRISRAAQLVESERVAKEKVEGLTGQKDQDKLF